MAAVSVKRSIAYVCVHNFFCARTLFIYFFIYLMTRAFSSVNNVSLICVVRDCAHIVGGYS